jgi:uncharacterized protein (DUF342 family)
LSHGTCDLDHLLKLSTDPPKLRGTLHVSPVESVKGISTLALESYLTSRDVLAKFIDSEAIDKLIALIHESPLEEHEMVVARGQPAVNGDSVSYTVLDSIQLQIESIKLREERLKSDPPEQIDSAELINDESISHYDQMAFVVVHKGDPIATRSERSEGVDGCDIFGKPIPSHEGKLNESVLDDSIHVNNEGLCTAAISGRLTASPLKISISSVLDIPGDVDFETGRIAFPGSVNIGGGVKSLFSVISTGPVEINGLVESADIESESSITLNRGMAGKDTGTILCKSNFTTGYVEAVSGIIHGDMIVRREITNSTLEINGQLAAEQATIRGGRTQVSKGAVLNVIGSPQGVETILAVGVLPRVEEEIRSIDELSSQLDTKAKEFQSQKETLSNAIAKPTPAQIEELMGIDFEIMECQSRIDKLKSARALHSQLFFKHTMQSIVVKKAIYAKSIIYLPGFKVEFNQDLIGESTIKLGSVGNPSITFRGQTVPLSEHAKVHTDETYLRIIEEVAEHKQAA